MAFWTGFLNGGGSRVQMAQAILSSDEYHTDVVQGLYEALLHRPADPSGLALGVWLLGMGNRDEVVEAALLGSPEYFVTRGGSANAGFVTAIYQDLLHRTPDTAGLAFWQVQLGAGMSRTAVANALLLSPERDQDVVASDYQVFLHRPVDPAGSAFWAHELSTGLTDEEVIASVVGSDEYFARP
jgi:hypothetical protein